VRIRRKPPLAKELVIGKGGTEEVRGGEKPAMLAQKGNLGASGRPSACPLGGTVGEKEELGSFLLGMERGED